MLDKGKLPPYKHLKIDVLPYNKAIYVDTSFIVSALLMPDASRIEELEKKVGRLTPEELKELTQLRMLRWRHEASVDFVERLVKDDMCIFFSSMLFQEMYFVLKFNELDKAYQNKEISKHKVKQDPKVITPHISNILQNWELFLALLNKFKETYPILPSEKKIIGETLRVRTEYCLKPNDSLHLGTVLAGPIEDIVVYDRDFREAALKEGLNVWYKI